MHLLYSAAIVCYALWSAPRLLYAAVRRGKYVGTLRERWGRLPARINPARRPSIWIHAVSVGEVQAARALIPGLRERYPDHPLWLSTTTATGRAVAAGIDGVDGLFYFPLDLPPAVDRVLDRVRPVLFLAVETELWPNLLRRCALRGVRTMLVNGRISDHSYPRYRLARFLFRRVLADVDRCCAQSAESARRLVDLGAPGDRVATTGNLKFDAAPAPRADPRAGKALRRSLGFAPQRPVLIAASTHPGEEAAVLDAFRQVRSLRPEPLLVLAPRHPERGAEVAALAARRGLPAVRRSRLPGDGAGAADVVVLDTVGELAGLFQAATVVFLGGSLVPVGGHNVIEPAAWGKPVVFGPHMQNFAEIAELFLANRAARRVAGEDELAPVLAELLSDPDARAALGAAARSLVAAHRGAAARSLTEIAAVLPPPGRPANGAVGREASARRGDFRRALLRPLGRLYAEAARRRRRWYGRHPEARRRLARPVVSVGALAVGGSGKTPLVAWLARLLVDMGERPAVLSRGYGRADPVEGAAVIRDFRRIAGSLAIAGDEPWMLARALDGAAVVVAADRHLAGRLAETRLEATVHVLDDGFQHLPLERGTDLVLLSTADFDDPLTLPAGPLREDLAAARCADAVLLVDVPDACAERVAAELPSARRFRVCRRAGAVRFRQPGAGTGGPDAGSRVAAVAGIARPGRFFDDLRAAGFDVVRALTYADHHRYRARDAERIQTEARRAGAQAIVTTEKDFVRLEPWLPFEPALAAMPLTAAVVPEEPFRVFLAERLAAERSGAR